MPRTLATSEVFFFQNIISIPKGLIIGIARNMIKYIDFSLVWNVQPYISVLFKGAVESSTVILPFGL